MKARDYYINGNQEVIHYCRSIYQEDYRRGIYEGSSKKSKSYMGVGDFIRIKTNYEDINFQYPYIEMLQHNFENHIGKKHRDIYKWMIVAGVTEPDFVYSDLNEIGTYYFDRIIEKKYVRVVVSRDRKGNLYVVTAYSFKNFKYLNNNKELVYRKMENF